ncbi:MAG: nucleoside-diphosphate sugar epimerase/dehydratase [Hyphomicrobiaceae bacterium]|nr:polysaccharide biosynthesis protein [Hyphomicrobiaceae bacterium]
MFVVRAGNVIPKIDAIDAVRARLFVRLLGLGRYAKRTVLVVNDLTLLAFSIWFAFTLRYGEFYVPSDWKLGLLMFMAPAIGVLVFAQIGLYRKVTRYIGPDVLNIIGASLLFSVLIWVFVIFLSGLLGTPRTVLVMYWVFGTLSVWGSRQFAGWLLNVASRPQAGVDSRTKAPVLIFGAGRAGLQLAQSLAKANSREVMGFLDLSPTLWGQYVDGYKVYRPARLAELIEREGIKEVLLALSDVPRNDRVKLIRDIEMLPVTVRTLPLMEDIATGRVTVSDLRPVGAEDLLGRDPVQANPTLVARTIEGKSVMVTGAGGSIGSELARQIVRHKAERVVLFEVSENGLYEIHREIIDILRDLELHDSVVPIIEQVLGSVTDAALVRRTIQEFGVQTIYHAAAYKHVPIVQKNVQVGFINNTLGTITVADAAQELGVERVVLISTDKAVRPSSLMGASKRLAEMALQARASVEGQRTIFTMVRFGNVLDSSGSVVRLFRDQIERGGPVTVTHKEMVRYFMSIPEAASLVMQAAAMATGGEVFVLDMGEPVKIDELARSMIRLMGRDVRDAINPEGEIAIEYVGLRPGEKLYEELLIGANTSGTEHPRIQRCEEPFLPVKAFEIELGRIMKLLESQDIGALHQSLGTVVEGYHVGGMPDAALRVAVGPRLPGDGARPKVLH